MHWHNCDSVCSYGNTHLNNQQMDKSSDPAKCPVQCQYESQKETETAIFETNKRVYFTATWAYLGAKMSSRLCGGKIKCDHVYFSSA